MSRHTPGRETSRGAVRASRRRRPSVVNPSVALPAAAAALVLVALIVPNVLRSGEAAASAGSPQGVVNGVDAPVETSTPPPPAVVPSATPIPTESVPQHGAGTTTVLDLPGKDTERTGRTVTYTVEAEDGVGVDLGHFAEVVRQVLTDQRGWEVQDKVHFVNVTPQQFKAGKHPEVRITLATPDTVDKMCAPMTTEGQVSCRNGERVALNAIRWTQGVEFYPDDLTGYRIYMVNHEVGHAIGHNHDVCAGPGKEAPVMLQQTLHLDGCTRYPWAVPGQKP